MNHIEKFIARIPSMEAKARAVTRRNAENTLRKSPDNLDARRIVDVLDALAASQPKAERFDITGPLAWEKYQRGATTTVRAFFGDQLVGRIIKRANHSGTEKDVYSVEMLGQMLAGNWHHIVDAHAAGEASFADKQKGMPE